jgi:hypothetical protein
MLCSRYKGTVAGNALRVHGLDFPFDAIFGDERGNEELQEVPDEHVGS